MIRIQSNSGDGRTFIFVHEKGIHQEFIAQAVDVLRQRVRVVVLETETITDSEWSRVVDCFAEKLQELGIRQCALVGFGATGALVQHLVLTSPKLVRSIILVDTSFRPHPTPISRAIDWIERILPLGLPLRMQQRGFDAKPFAQRIRCPALIVLTPSISPFLYYQAHEIAVRIPSAWIVTLERTGYVEHFCQLLDTFEGVPVKCPQKNR